MTLILEAKLCCKIVKKKTGWLFFAACVSFYDTSDFKHSCISWYLHSLMYILHVMYNKCRSVDRFCLTTFSHLGALSGLAYHTLSSITYEYQQGVYTSVNLEILL